MNDEHIIIYIRHAEDRTRDKYKYDPKLTYDGHKESKMLSNQLISEYGIPDMIYCSPYSRTRQTLKNMLKTISMYTDKKIPKEIDNRLSRFFTKKQMYNPDISKKTRKLGAPIYERWGEFKQRVDDQLTDMENQKEYKIIWCIGHTLINKLVAKYKNIEHDKYISYLDTVIIKS